MLNIDGTEDLNQSYFLQKDLFSKGVNYSIGVITFLNLLRNQVAEINLLQLIPGFYLLLLFFSFVLLVFCSNFFVRLPLNYDNNKSFGTKISPKAQIGLLIKLSLFLLLGSLVITINTLLPLSLDSFNSYGEKTLENLWSFNEVLGLETILLTIILFLSQTPATLLSNLGNEKNLLVLPKFWKTFSFVVFIIAGVLTPTIDGYTQLGFASSALILSILIINLIEKRLRIKFVGISFLGH